MALAVSPGLTTTPNRRASPRLSRFVRLPRLALPSHERLSGVRPAEMPPTWVVDLG